MTPGSEGDGTFYDSQRQSEPTPVVSGSFFPWGSPSPNVRCDNRPSRTAFTGSGGEYAVPVTPFLPGPHVATYNEFNPMTFTYGYTYPYNKAAFALKVPGFGEVNPYTQGDFRTDPDAVLGNMYPNIPVLLQEQWPVFESNSLPQENALPQSIYVPDANGYELAPQGGYADDIFSFGKNIEANFTFEFEDPLASVIGSPNPFAGRFPADGIKKQSQCEYLKPLGSECNPYRFECTNCRSRFHEAGDAKKHAVRQLRLMVCKYSPQCDKTFGRKKLWETHMENCKFGKQAVQAHSSPYGSFCPL